MKIKEIIAWKGNGSSYRRLHTRFDSRCLVQILRLNYGQVVVFSDFRWENSGVSITNSIERIASLVKRAYHLKGGTYWIEHYYHQGPNAPDSIDRETIDLVALEEGLDGWYKSPAWVGLPSREVAKSIFGLDESIFEPVEEDSLTTLDLSRWQNIQSIAK